MAILYGTQSNGETLPVLVDQFGNLLAKGIEGTPGAPGEPGTPGAPGEPGEPGKDGADGGAFPLPPDPYEGAILGWLNNDLAWIGTPPIPVPPGRFGPITAWDAAGLLTVEGKIPEQIKTGVFVYQCNEDGTIYVDGWNNSQVWSSYLSTNTSFDNSPANGFNGVIGGAGFNLDWGVRSAGVSTITFSGVSVPVSSSLVVYVYGGNNNEVSATDFRLNGNPASVVIEKVSGVTDGGVRKCTYNVSYPLTLSSLSYSNDDPGKSTMITAIEVDGELLTDAGDYPTAPNLNLRVQTVNGQNLIGVANRTDNFTPGKYLMVPGQKVARWLYDGTLDKLITHK